MTDSIGQNSFAVMGLNSFGVTHEMPVGTTLFHQPFHPMALQTAAVPGPV